MFIIMEAAATGFSLPEEWMTPSVPQEILVEWNGKLLFSGAE